MMLEPISTFLASMTQRAPDKLGKYFLSMPLPIVALHVSLYYGCPAAFTKFIGGT